ncbi:hypothetical protein BESB_033380 [Besnoitia besnoiti]|uniref:Uncharacterized protein n=1 Tax=Besnoitia besnoiti TaxID=94643 RepID=A0A2A9MMQ3_BESBE|nr:hypothetical protein BESB_033380 [Besnoitia besnoiti]PFH36880.1 hypothetical protein BESB_033380 [Besnoitia besnoiti]
MPGDFSAGHMPARHSILVSSSGSTARFSLPSSLLAEDGLQYGPPPEVHSGCLGRGTRPRAASSDSEEVDSDEGEAAQRRQPLAAGRACRTNEEETPPLAAAPHHQRAWRADADDRVSEYVPGVEGAAKSEAQPTSSRNQGNYGGRHERGYLLRMPAQTEGVATGSGRIFSGDSSGRGPVDLLRLVSLRRHGKSCFRPTTLVRQSQSGAPRPDEAGALPVRPAPVDAETASTAPSPLPPSRSGSRAEQAGGHDELVSAADGLQRKDLHTNGRSAVHTARQKGNEPVPPRGCPLVAARGSSTATPHLVEGSLPEGSSSAGIRRPRDSIASSLDRSSTGGCPTADSGLHDFLYAAAASPHFDEGAPRGEWGETDERQGESPVGSFFSAGATVAGQGSPRSCAGLANRASEHYALGPGTRFPATAFEGLTVPLSEATTRAAESSGRLREASRGHGRLDKLTVKRVRGPAGASKETGKTILRRRTPSDESACPTSSTDRREPLRPSGKRNLNSSCFALAGRVDGQRSLRTEGATATEKPTSKDRARQKCARYFHRCVSAARSDALLEVRQFQRMLHGACVAGEQTRGEFDTAQDRAWFCSNTEQLPSKEATQYPLRNRGFRPFGVSDHVGNLPDGLSEGLPLALFRPAESPPDSRGTAVCGEAHSPPRASGTGDASGEASSPAGCFGPGALQRQEREGALARWCRRLLLVQVLRAKEAFRGGGVVIVGRLVKVSHMGVTPCTSGDGGGVNVQFIIEPQRWCSICKVVAGSLDTATAVAGAPGEARHQEGQLKGATERGISESMRETCSGTEPRWIHRPLLLGLLRPRMLRVQRGQPGWGGVSSEPRGRATSAGKRWLLLHAGVIPITAVSYSL